MTISLFINWGLNKLLFFNLPFLPLYVSIRYRLLCPNLQNLSLLSIFQESWLPSCPLKHLQVLWNVLNTISFIYMQENLALAFKNVNEKSACFIFFSTKFLSASLSSTQFVLNLLFSLTLTILLLTLHLIFSLGLFFH